MGVDDVLLVVDVFVGLGVGCVVLARCGILVVLHGCWVVGCWFGATSRCFVWVRPRGVLCGFGGYLGD